jgi:hypothetical protein
MGLDCAARRTTGTFGGKRENPVMFSVIQFPRVTVGCVNWLRVETPRPFTYHEAPSDGSGKNCV